LEKINIQFFGFFLIVVFLLSAAVIGLTPQGFSQTREESSTTLEKFTKTDPDINSPELAKIDPIIRQWQTSLDPEKFARDNNLSFSNNKIRVYVYLDTVESISNIPQDIDVEAFDENIVVALVSSDIEQPFLLHSSNNLS
jgi:hypothetical protein